MRHQVLITGSLHPDCIQSLSLEPDLEISYQPDLPYREIIKIIHPFHCIISRSETAITQELIDLAPTSV